MPTQGRIVCLTALGIDEDNGSTHDYTFAPTACSSRSEVINIADERSPHSPGFEAKPWPYKFCSADIPGYVCNADPSEFTHVYEAALSTAGGDDTTMAKSLLLKFSVIA